MSTNAPVTEHDARRAPVWVRGCAFVLDFLWSYLALSLVIFAVSHLAEVGSDLLRGLIDGAALLFCCVWLLMFEGSVVRNTPGKWLLGLAPRYQNMIPSGNRMVRRNMVKCTPLLGLWASGFLGPVMGVLVLVLSIVGVAGLWAKGLAAPALHDRYSKVEVSVVAAKSPLAVVVTTAVWSCVIIGLTVLSIQYCWDPLENTISISQDPSPIQTIQ